MKNTENETTCPCNTNQCGCAGKGDCQCGEACECGESVCECSEGGGCGCKP